MQEQSTIPGRGPLIRTCEKCSGLFKTFPSVIAKGAGKYCSMRCYAGRNTPADETSVGQNDIPGRGTLVRGCQACGKPFRTYPSTISRYPAMTCSLECRDQIRRVPPEERFWKHVDLSSECWIWTGGKTGTGYGHMWIVTDNNHILAHRMSYQMHHGPIPDGLQVCHKCDNPPCVNPSHLFLGTAKDNALDKIAKGRGRAPYGEKHWRSKLTEQQVVEIRQIHATEGLSFNAIGRRFAVKGQAVKKIVHRQLWKHVA